jgi:hypothetical protein
MASYVAGPTKSFTTGAAIAQYLRVVYGSGVVTVAGASAMDIGTLTEASFANGDVRAVHLANAQGTSKMVASVAITSGALVYAAADGKIAATGTVLIGEAMEAAAANNDVIEVLRFANADIAAGLPGTGVPKVLRTRATLLEVNAGLTLVAAKAGVKFRVHDVALISIGGAAAGATTVDILGTQSASGVKLLAAAVAGLTQNTLLRAGAANATILAGGVSFAANDTNTAITIGATGTLTTSTHIDVLLTYEEVSA